MIRIALANGLLALALSASPALAQSAGGLAVGGASPGGLAAGMIAPPGPPILGPPPNRTPTSVASINPARNRTAISQTLVAQIRGDPGFLAGFQKGEPLAFSRQPPPEPFIVPNVTFIDAPFIVNNFLSDVDIDLAEPSVTTNPAPGDEPEDGAAEGGETVTGAIPPVLSGGVAFNNVGSLVNAVIGNGNEAVQTIAPLP